MATESVDRFRRQLRLRPTRKVKKKIVIWILFIYKAHYGHLRLSYSIPIGMHMGMNYCLPTVVSRGLFIESFYSISLILAYGFPFVLMCQAVVWTKIVTVHVPYPTW